MILTGSWKRAKFAPSLPLKATAGKLGVQSSIKKLLAVKIMLVIGNNFNYSVATFKRQARFPSRGTAATPGVIGIHKPGERTTAIA